MRPSPKIAQVDDSHLDERVLEHSRAVLMAFSSESPDDSRHLLALLESALAARGHGVEVMRIDVHRNPRAAATLGVDQVPALVGIRDGQVVRQLTGEFSAPRIAELLNDLTASQAARTAVSNGLPLPPAPSNGHAVGAASTALSPSSHEPATPGGATLGDHLATIWAGRWWLLVSALAVAVTVFLWSSTRPKVWQGEASVTVSVPDAIGQGSALQQDVSFLLQRDAELASTDPVLSDAIKRARVAVPLEQARREVSVTPSKSLSALNVRVTGPRDQVKALAAGTAAALLDAVARQQERALSDELKPLEQSLKQTRAHLSALPAADLTRPDPAVEQRRDALRARYERLQDAIIDRRARRDVRFDVGSPASISSQPVAPVPVRDAMLAFLAAFVVFAELWVAGAAIRRRRRGSHGASADSGARP